MNRTRCCCTPATFWIFPTLFLVLLLVACGADRTAPDSSHSVSGGSTQTATGAAVGVAKGEQDWFVDRASEVGLEFLHFNGMAGHFYLPENMGPGVALLDYDNDGDLDAYVVQGKVLGSGKPGETRFPWQAPTPPRGRLFRNELEVHEDGSRTLRFTDVTANSGIIAREFGMGAAVGDYNNDGCVDLFLTNFGANQLFHNNCNGTFTDVSGKSGTDDPRWSVSAAFVDYDRDGWLDLFVGNYLRYSIEADRKCFHRSGEQDYCHPSVYQADPDRLYHNNHNGTFTDVTAKALVGGAFGPTLGVSTADVTGDGWIDIFVANDSQENQLWINQRDGTFRDTALLAGVALTPDGQAEASMGVDAGDFDNDGDEDLFMTELTSEGSNLYVNDGSGVFDDQSMRSGLGPRSIAYTGFGTAWIDFDNDGWLDILTVNGTITAIEALQRVHDPFPQHQRKQLFRNSGDGSFEEVTDRAGAAFQLSEVGRGAAFGDIDNDGDSDVIVGNDAGRTRLLVNNVGSDKHWVGLRLTGEHGRDMLGARVAVLRPNKQTLWRRTRSDGSYASANDPRVLVGLGDSTDRPRVRVIWPSGRVEEWAGVPIDRYTTLKEGTAR